MDEKVQRVQNKILQLQRNRCAAYLVLKHKMRSIPKKPHSGSPYQEIRCPMCDKLRREWNKHHLKDGWARVCANCHDDINFFFSPYEQDELCVGDLGKMKRLLIRRRNAYIKKHNLKVE